MATLTEFTEIRELILKNSIYNRILIAKLSSCSEFYVASTLLKLKDETKQELSKDIKRKKFPTYALYDIVVKFHDYGNFGIGLRFPSHPIIWEYPSIPLKNLKELSKFVYEKYSVNPAKCDKIFSSLSHDTKLFFENNNYSSRFWHQGFSKKVSESEDIPIDIATINKYLDDLRKRNSEYRMFNTILLSMLKIGQYSKNQPGFGSIAVTDSIMEGKFYVIFNSYLDYRIYSELFPISAFSPSMWDTFESDIDKNILMLINL